MSTAPVAPETPWVLVAGEALIDVVRQRTEPSEPSGEADPADRAERSYPGGSPANVAVGLSRLEHPVQLATWIAADQHGAKILQHLQRAGVGVTPGSQAAGRTPVAVATLDEHGMAQYDFDLSWELPSIDLHGVTHLHTGSIAATMEPGASAVLELMIAARGDATISYDPNLRPSIMGEPHEVRSRIEECIGRSDVVKASDEDVAGLYDGAPPETVAELWSRLGPDLVVITRGGDGALVHLGGSGEQFTLPANQVTVADTVGAGDSFMAGLLSGLLDAGLLGGVEARSRLATAEVATITEAVRRGMATGAYTVQRAGAVAPTRRDLQES